MTKESTALNTIKNFILTEYLPGEDPENLTPTTPLLSGGILTSLATLQLVAFLEENFNIQIAAHEADKENFDSLEAICRLVDSKRT